MNALASGRPIVGFKPPRGICAPEQTANPRAVHSCLIPNCPASATGPGLECRASIKHGPGMRMHMPRRRAPLSDCTVQLHTHRAITYSPR